MGPIRWVVVHVVRSVVLALLIIALADVQMGRTSDRLTVIYLLDQSESIPVERRNAMLKYVNAAISQHREDRDRVGVVVFGRDAAIEIPPFDDDIQVLRVESTLDPDHTNLSKAIKLAHLFMVSPEKGAQTSIYLASDPEVAVISGGYFVKKRRRRPSSAARDDVLARRLWQLSSELVDL